jgi:hypothetical protein|tara:strand:+ start:354 stop:869 length:516 start_codon:yes stop_codon:yes gene_type:complete
LLHSTILGKNKQYNISIYDTFKAFTITLEDSKISIQPVRVGSFLLKEDIEYKNQSFGSDNLVVQLLSDKKINILDTGWVEDIPVLDNVTVNVRFLFAEEEEILLNNEKTMALLYRMDIKKTNLNPDDKNLINTALIDSSLRKVWIDKNTGSIIKLSFMYNGISYIITKNEN